MKTLNDTVSMMNSVDYRERFRAEYYQLVIRYKKLKAMLEKWDKGELDFAPDCNRGILNMQERVMADYIAILESRAQIEDVDIGDVDV